MCFTSILNLHFIALCFLFELMDNVVYDELPVLFVGNESFKTPPVGENIAHVFPHKRSNNLKGASSMNSDL